MDAYDEHDVPFDGERSFDRRQAAAVDELRAFFDLNRERVFSSRQIEVAYEDTYFHWITHRALHDLAGEGTIRIEQRALSSGAPINLVWHRTNRYTRRQAKEVLDLVERYSHPEFTAALGNTAELLVSDGFGRFGFLQRGRETQVYNGRQWTKSQHNLDFIFERDGRAYGVEVKNTLPYINDRELRIKIELCQHLHLHPVFVVRAMPRVWIQEIAAVGGFTLVLKYHLYPLSHKTFAMEIREKLGLPVDAPRALYDGTMQRFVRWHERHTAKSG